MTLRFFIEPFLTDRGRPFWPLVLLYVAINAIVIINCRHEVNVGYDSGPHMAYADTLAQGRLPRKEDTVEFFSAPLGYVFPAILRAAGCSLHTAVSRARDLQVVCSLVVTFVMLRLCLRASRDHWVRLVALLMLGMLPSYYRTMGLWRAEATLAMLAVIAIDVSLGNARWKVIALGVLSGLIILTRQWGFMLLPAIVLPQALDLLHRRMPWRVLRDIAVVVALTALIGGWFYASLGWRFGSVTAFNRPPQPGPYLERQPASFYLDIPIRTITHKPMVHELGQRLIPQFYADLWGDYYLCFAVYGQDGRGRFIHGRPMLTRLRRGERISNNVDFMVRQLGRNNSVSLIPTIVFLAGIGYGVISIVRATMQKDPDGRTMTLASCATVVLVSAAGYLWFLIGYTDGTGDTIKATYMLQVYPFAAVLAAAVLEPLRAPSRRWMFWTMLVALVAVAAHNSPAYFTRFYGRAGPNEPTTAPKLARGPRVVAPPRPSAPKKPPKKSATTKSATKPSTKPVKKPTRQRSPRTTTTATTTIPASTLQSRPER